MYTFYLSYWQTISYTLAAPTSVTDTIDRMADFMKTFSKSVIPDEQREDDFRNILQAIIDPVLATCKRHASQHANAAESTIFVLNCLIAFQNALNQYPSFTAKYSDFIASEVDHYMEQFIRSESRKVLEQCGLFDKLQAIKEGKVEIFLYC